MGSALLVFVGMLFLTLVMIVIAATLSAPPFYQSVRINDRWEHYNRSILSKSILTGLSVGMVVAFAFSVLFTFVSILNTAAFSTQRFDPHIARAEQSATAQEMTGNLNLLIAEMESAGMTQGYTDGIFQNPGNDMALTYQHVLILRDRGIQVSSISGDSTAYGVNMTDLKDSMNSTSVHAGDWYFVRSNEPVNAFYAWMAGLILLVSIGVADRLMYLAWKASKSRSTGANPHLA